jgi:hypothetical protein
MISVSPVLTEEHVESERVIALDQAEYTPLIILPVMSDVSDGMVVRFRLNEEERARVAAGGDLVIMELTFGRQFTPIALGIVMPGVAPTGKDW